MTKRLIALSLVVVLWSAQLAAATPQAGGLSQNDR